MSPKDIQQLHSGFRTHAILSGPVTVEVLEALDAAYSCTKHRYFISVGGKFRECDALNIGQPGWLGCTKGEANKAAATLSHCIYIVHGALGAAKERALQWDTFTNRYTVQMQENALQKLIGKYCATIESATSKIAAARA